MMSSIPVQQMKSKATINWAKNLAPFLISANLEESLYSLTVALLGLVLEAHFNVLTTKKTD